MAPRDASRLGLLAPSFPSLITQPFVMRAQISCLLALMGSLTLSEAQEKLFSSSGKNVMLQELTTNTTVTLQSLRLNRALNEWNVDVLVSNRSDQTIFGPLIVELEALGGTSGLLRPDGVTDDQPPRGYVDLSPELAEKGMLGTRGVLSKRTLALGVKNAAPQVKARVYARGSSAAALATVRTLNQLGQPLGGVTVEVTGPDGTANIQTEAFGLASVGQGAGLNRLHFTAPGYLPVWREQTLDAGGITVLANPRLTQRVENPTFVSALFGGTVSNASSTIRVRFDPGAFTQDTPMRLTPLEGQSLPGLLPAGWSPMQAFWLELGAEPSAPAVAQLAPWGPVRTNENAVLAKWNVSTLRWDALGVTHGNGVSALAFSLSSGGAYAVVVGDTGATPAPAPEIGQPLAPATTTTVDLGQLTAGGTVDPAASPASTVPGLVTARATLNVTHRTGSLASGLVLRCDVQESYQLLDGTRRLPPPFETFIVGYQRPGGGSPGTLQAQFPIRPGLLFGPETLQEGRVRAEIRTPSNEAGVVIAGKGGMAAQGGLWVVAGANDLAQPQGVQVKRLEPTNFAELAAGGVEIVAAFDLTWPGLQLGQTLSVQVNGAPKNALFVVARVVARDGLYGLEPRERLASDAAGRLSTQEPPAGERLPGIASSGQYLLVKVPVGQGLVAGVARNSAGQPRGGLPVRISGQPWLTFSTVPDGGFQLLAPTGVAQVVLTDPATGDTGAALVSVADPTHPISATLSTTSVGPQVIAFSPTNSASLVSLVTAVTVRFDKPLRPGSVLGGALALVDTLGRAVDASVSLNLAGTEVTLLPANPLAGSTTYTVQAGTNVLDLAGRPLLATAAASFTTAADGLNRLAGAQLISYEPTNGVARVEGTQGFADPGAPVILVNETTGRTATVLSKPDGSFQGSIEMEVDDRIRAVVVNQNGTRNEFLVSRQVFSDGSIGLFNGGGVLQAPTPNGPLEVVIEPHAIEGKAIMKLASLSTQQVLSLASNTLPESGTVIGGMSFRLEGEPLRQGGHIAFPVLESQLV